MKFTKKDYQKFARAHFKIFSWLSVLPYYVGGKPVTLSVPVPIVITPLNAEPPAGFAFRWSTLHYVTGHDIPHGTQLRALVKLR